MANYVVYDPSFEMVRFENIQSSFFKDHTTNFTLKAHSRFCRILEIELYQENCVLPVELTGKWRHFRNIVSVTVATSDEFFTSKGFASASKMKSRCVPHFWTNLFSCLKNWIPATSMFANRKLIFAFSLSRWSVDILSSFWRKYRYNWLFFGLKRKFLFQMNMF